ncbi:cysteine desulfurase [Fodinicurvata sp. EGI_FJ10296]|uniref:aminotransferase class V-fold PLP-dependent enzyme n=1 Tax=Fodinicurvata sp. EGI_FJ10296 TaxID=3231908 RepID=UPI00345480B6
MERHRSAVGAYDLAAIRSDFPILDQMVHGKPLAYLDNAASAQKPHAVIDSLVALYSHDYANVHRGLHALSSRATDRYEAARETVREHLNAPSEREIVFTKGATEALNLLAACLGQGILRQGDEVIITGLEHHSNIVPWQLLRDRMRIVLKIVPVGDNGDVDPADLRALLTDRTRVVSVAHMSNALGTILPVEEMVADAKAAGAITILDGCQAVSHMKVDVRALGCDAYVFSGHKVYGPTGIGILWAREDLLDRLPPYHGGGEMIRSVTFEKSTWADLPAKFEAGTPPIAGAVGLKAALDYVNGIGMELIARHEASVFDYAVDCLESIEGVSLIGKARRRASILSFVMDVAHPHDIATLVDRQGVAVRAGHHCAQPLMDRFGLPATARASIGLYNSIAEIDQLAEALHRVRRLLA